MNVAHVCTQIGKRWDSALIEVQAKTAVRCLVLPTKICEINMMRIFVQWQSKISAAIVQRGMGGVRRSSAMARQLPRWTERCHALGWP
eukprot:2670286-Amphidinium_carterae.1